MVISKRNNLSIFTRMFLCLIFTVIVLVPNSARADQLLNMIPADCLFCVRVNNITHSLNAVDSYITGISPIGLDMMLRAQLGQMLSNPELKGLNLNGSAAVFGPLPGGTLEDDEDICIIIPITNFNELVASSAPITAEGNIATIENVSIIFFI